MIRNGVTLIILSLMCVSLIACNSKKDRDPSGVEKGSERSAACVKAKATDDGCDDEAEEEKTCYDHAKTEVDRLFCKAEEGNIPAMEEIADRHHAGQGLPRELSRAAHWYRQSADRQSAYGQFMLSVLYDKGRGVKQNLATSVQWFDRGMKHKGSSLAQFRVGKRYAKGYGLPQDDHEAEKWFEFAAKQRFAPAQIEMGDIFYQGRGEEIDYERAFNWYLLAAEQGHSYAETMVGLMLLEGKGVDVSLPDALIWIEKSAHKGARQAQYQLGRLYFYGLGVKQSDVRAYAWWDVSMEGVQDKRPAEMDALVERMGPTARHSAVRLAREYQHKYRNKGILPKI